MAGRRRKVVAKDYDALIKASEAKIEKLTNDLSEERKNLKQLKKDRDCYETQKAEEAKAKQMEEVAKLIAESDKSIDEIKAFLTK